MKLIIYWARNGCLYNSTTQKGVCHEIIDKNPVYNRSFSGSTFLNQLPNTVQLLQKSQNLVSKQVHKLLVVWRRFAMVRTSTNWYRMEIRLNAFSSVNFQKKMMNHPYRNHHTILIRIVSLSRFNHATGIIRAIKVYITLTAFQYY